MEVTYRKEAFKDENAGIVKNGEDAGSLGPENDNQGG
jgi:hypothetical protein